MKRERRKLIFITTTATFTLMLLYEATKELIFKGTLTPWESHWITILFTTMASCILTLASLNQLSSFKERIHKVRIREEKMNTFRRTVSVVNYHVNTLSNGLGLVELEVEEKGVVDRETLTSLRHSIEETTRMIQNLNSVADSETTNLFKE